MKKQWFVILSCFILCSFNSNENEIKQLLSKSDTLEYVRLLKNNNSSQNYYFCLVSSHNWDYTFKRKGIDTPIVMQENDKFEIVSSLGYTLKNFDEMEGRKVKNENIIHTTFFSNYENSNFYKQLNSYKMKDCLVYILDIDNDGNEDFLNFGHADINSPWGFVIRMYIDNQWKKVFSEPYFGFYDWDKGYLWDTFDETALYDEWFESKPFPYEFVEYKGKVGLRIVCYDRPRERPTHYHAQFWAYDEEAQEYKMLEEVAQSIERTPADGLIFADSPDFLPMPWPKFSMLGARLSAADFAGMDKAQLRLLRNAVYARHGRTFASADLQALFGGYVWYKPNPDYSDDLLTETDRANIALIKEFEKRQ